jgi:hypothetical protein
MKHLKKTRDNKIDDAFRELEKAVKMERPDIAVRVPEIYSEEEASKFALLVKTFAKEWKKYTDKKKVDLELIF